MQINVKCLSLQVDTSAGNLKVIVASISVLLVLVLVLLVVVVHTRKCVVHYTKIISQCQFLQSSKHITITKKLMGGGGGE